MITAINYGRYHPSEIIGHFVLGSSSQGKLQTQWSAMLKKNGKYIVRWHALQEGTTKLMGILKKHCDYRWILLCQTRFIRNYAYFKFFCSPILNLVLFNLILSSQISMCQNFRYLEVAFQSLIYISIQIMFVM